MRLRRFQVALATAAAALALSGCGGGGGGGAGFIPAPPATPTPPPPTPMPTPPSPSPLPPPHIGLVSSAPFAVLASADEYTTTAAGTNRTLVSGPSFANVQFSYEASTNSYRISLPGYNSGTLTNTGYNGTVGQPATSSTSQLMEDSFGFVMPVHIFLPVPGASASPYTYTSFGTWDGELRSNNDNQIVRGEGIFAYGIPTAPGDMPTAGSASYTAQIVGTMGPNTYPPNGVGGDVNLLFNFAAGTLSGSMHPQIVDGFDGIFVDFGKYDFTQTVYSTGSTSFSGKFIVPGLPSADSSFEGQFTGPGAAELMSRFRAPFRLNGNDGVISGIWIGKKN